MADPTEPIRRQHLVEANVKPGSREALENRYGRVWDTQELRRDFHVLGFAASLVVVRRKSDGVRGVLEFQHHPRFYFNLSVRSFSFSCCRLSATQYIPSPLSRG